MEKRINIAELLKDCPQGMELDCAMWDDAKFDKIDTGDDFPIRIQIGGRDICESFTEFGQWHHNDKAKCVIFPKGKTTWEGFVPPCKFKDGDIVATTKGAWIGITTGGESGELIPTHCVIKFNGEFEVYLNKKDRWYFDRLASEEEKQKLFQAIKDNGYKWNAETKTPEELIEPRFKVGDRIWLKENHNYIYTITGIRKEENKYECGVTFVLRFSEQDNWELVPNKFDVSTLIPFESRVLVRDSDVGIWLPEFFGCLCDGNDYPYMIVGGTRWKCCIPYEGNEHLIGKTDDCDDKYKNWKE